MLIQPRAPAKPVRIRTFASQVEDSLFSERLMMLLTSMFGMLALGLAAVGLYGLMSYTVSTRTREIGVRLALGARPARVLRMVVAQRAAHGRHRDHHRAADRMAGVTR